MDFCNGMMVTVQQGDTLYSLSMRYQVPLDVMLRSNPYVDVYNLQEGEQICVPMRQRPVPEQWPGEERTVVKAGETPKKEQSVLSQESEVQMQTEQEERNIEDIREEYAQERRGEQREDDREDDRISWERYVTKPGDTLEVVIGTGVGRNRDGEDELEEFIEKNGRDNIYLLPGVAYRRRK